MRILVAIIAVLTASCGTPAGVLPRIESEARRFVAPADKARVYVYRPSIFYGDGELLAIDIGQVSGALVPVSFMIADLKPGEYQITARGETVQVSQLQVNAGNIYFVRATYGFGVKAVPEKKGRKTIANYGMVWSSCLPPGSSTKLRTRSRRPPAETESPQDDGQL